MAESKKSVFEVLNAINVNGHTESKNGLTYLSWAWAWAEVKKAFPLASYTIYENADGWNYFTDGKTCWVKTGVTIEGLEHIEYLPVMDFKNKSIPVGNVTSFDVNKSIQRSLTKAVARHGLGLYIYAGEDLPEAEEEAPAPKNTASKKTPAKTFNPTGDIAPNGEPMEAPKTQAEVAPKKPSYPHRNEFLAFCKENELDVAEICKEKKLTKASKDEDFIEALSYAVKLVALKEQQETGVELPYEI